MPRRAIPLGQKAKNLIKKIGPLYYFLLKLDSRRKICKNIPNGLAIELTNRCNLYCEYCPRSSGYNSGTAGDMDFAFFKKIIDDAYENLHLKQICLTGFGETFLYPYIFEAIEYIKNKSPKIKIFITTNGILLDDKISKKIIQSELDSLTISVNFINREKYKMMNGSDFYDSVVKNTKSFLDLVEREGSGKPKIHIQILDTLNTKEEVEEFSSYWQPYLIQNSAIQIQPYVNWAGLIKEKDSGVRKRARYPCGHLSASVINKDGDVLACCMTLPLSKNDKTLFVGNLKEGNILSFINSGKMNKLRELNVGEGLEGVSICRNCDAWKSSINVWFRNRYLKWAIKRKWL